VRLEGGALERRQGYKTHYPKGEGSKAHSKGGMVRKHNTQGGQGL